MQTVKLESELEPKLTDEQNEFVSKSVPDKNHTMVVACAGSGKTLAMSHAISKLFVHNPTSDKIIQAVTFTKRASKSLAKRIQKTCPSAFETKKELCIIQCSTFHSFCRRWMKAVRPWLFQGIVYHVDEYLNWMYEWLSGQDEFKNNRCSSSSPAVHLETPEKWSKMFSHIFVDEFQDVDELQYNIIREMKKLNPKLKVTVIGDDAQTIYAWRGSQTDIMARFLKDYDPVSLFKFSVNHRSHARITQLANEMLKTFESPVLSPQQFPGKDAEKHYKPRRAVKIFACESVFSAVTAIRDDLELIRDVHQEIMDMPVEKRPKKAHKKLGDFCILARNAFILHNLQAALLERKIPCQLYSGNDDWYQTGEDDNDDQDIKDLYKERTFVTLSTVHSAKGLEWPHVIGIGLENGYFPDKLSNMEEERRLAYVLVTRAMKSLTLYTTRGTKCDLISATFLQNMLEENGNDDSDTEMEDEKNDKTINRRPKRQKPVKNAVKGLKNSDFLHIKRKIWPADLEDRITVIEGEGGVDTAGYPAWVAEKQLHSEYGTFLECLVHRMIAEYYHTDKVVDKQVKLCASKTSFSHLSFKQKTKWKSMAAIYENRKQFPEWNNPQVIESTWHMSLSGAIISGRKSSLFKKVSKAQLTDTSSMKRYDRMERNLHKYLANCIRCTDSVSISYKDEKVSLGLEGEIDLVLMLDKQTAVLIDLKNSFYDCKKLKASNLLQLWVYACMIRIEKQINVETILILNQMGNVTFAISLKNWDRDKELLDFILLKTFENVKSDNV